MMYGTMLPPDDPPIPEDLEEKKREAADVMTPQHRLVYYSFDANLQAIVAANPNTPLGSLVALARLEPQAVVSNCVLPLLLLEDPGAFDHVKMRTVRAMANVEGCPRRIRERYKRMNPDDAIKLFDELLPFGQQTLIYHGKKAVYRRVIGRLRKTKTQTFEDVCAILLAVIAEGRESFDRKHDKTAKYMHGVLHGLARLSLMAKELDLVPVRQRALFQ